MEPQGQSTSAKIIALIGAQDAELQELRRYKEGIEAERRRALKKLGSISLPNAEDSCKLLQTMTDMLTTRQSADSQISIIASQKEPKQFPEQISPALNVLSTSQLPTTKAESAVSLLYNKSVRKILAKNCVQLCQHSNL